MKLSPVALSLGLAILLAACGRGSDNTIIVERAAVPESSPIVSIVEEEAAEPPPESIAAATAPSAAPATPSPAATPAPAARGPASLADYLTGNIDPARDPAFKRIPEKYLGGSRVWGHAEAVDALVAMADAAAADGVQLKAVSAFRSFRDQKRIWEDKWEGRVRVEGAKLNETIADPATRARKILEYSSMPATSRHHWGTDFDFNNLNNSWFASGEGKRVYDWLVANAGDYGFCQTYSPKSADRPEGYEEEKWHWSYLPVARGYLEQYPAVIGYDRITGFAGAEAAREIGVIANYVEGINPACR